MEQIFQDKALEEQENFWKDKIKMAVKKNIKKETKQEIPSFKCRVCGHNTYIAVYNENSSMLGGRCYPIAYRCGKCSVIFADPKEFSLKE